MSKTKLDPVAVSIEGNGTITTYTTISQSTVQVLVRPRPSHIPEKEYEIPKHKLWQVLDGLSTDGVAVYTEED